MASHASRLGLLLSIRVPVRHPCWYLGLSIAIIGVLDMEQTQWRVMHSEQLLAESMQLIGEAPDHIVLRGSRSA